MVDMLGRWHDRAQQNTRRSCIEGVAVRLEHGDRAAMPQAVRGGNCLLRNCFSYPAHVPGPWRVYGGIRDAFIVGMAASLLLNLGHNLSLSLRPP